MNPIPIISLFSSGVVGILTMLVALLVIIWGTTLRMSPDGVLGYVLCALFTFAIIQFLVAVALHMAGRISLWGDE